ncbi:hypothetical protein [Saccharopolyspora shandongensis]|uniref:hypothetical protein n=1 Tax=Saccharopolyspora shandongensis TaxID=418495 RepID=UPI0033EA45FF
MVAGGDGNIQVKKAESDELTMLMQKATEKMETKLQETVQIVQKIADVLGGDWKNTWHQLQTTVDQEQAKMHGAFGDATKTHGQLSQNYRDVDRLAAGLFNS